MGRPGWAAVLLLACLASGPPAAGARGEAPRDLGDLGAFPQWGKIEVRLAGWAAAAEGDPNPFDASVDVEFQGPHGRVFRVPGYYDGDGEGGEQGRVWQVRFAADAIGPWTFRSVRTADGLEAVSGRFTVTPAPPTAPGFYRWGRLEHVGTRENGIRYLKFRDGPFWMKAGSDNPENFLGAFVNFDTPAKRRRAIAYFSRRGINSQYIMLHNIGGDHQDVWPWLGADQAAAKANAGASARFDIPKLREWQALFEYMQAQGVVPYLILEDDSAWTGFHRGRYYREVIARFGYLPAVIFNLGEEWNENYSLRQGIRFAKLFRHLDPYGHPLGLHNVNTPRPYYVGASVLGLASIQTDDQHDAAYHNDLAQRWIRAARRMRTRPLMVGFDEPRPVMDRRGWWGGYLGGGVWQIHTGEPYDRDPREQDQVWRELGGARQFMESLPFWEMQPLNEALREGKGFCLAKPGEVYAVYLPEGGRFGLDLPAGRAFQVEWWDPGNDVKGRFRQGPRVCGTFGGLAPPGDGDWAVRLTALPGTCVGP